MDRKAALMVRLSGLLFWFDESLQASLDRAGFEPLSRTQSMFLTCLASGLNKPSEIARQLGVSRQAISHIINYLSDRGLIVLSVDPEDARARIVEYTDDAQELRVAAHTVLTELNRLLKRRIGANAYESLRSGLAGEWGETALVELPQRQPRKRAKKA